MSRRAAEPTSWRCSFLVEPPQPPLRRFERSGGGEGAPVGADSEGLDAEVDADLPGRLAGPVSVRVGPFDLDGERAVPPAGFTGHGGRQDAGGPRSQAAGQAAGVLGGADQPDPGEGAVAAVGLDADGPGGEADRRCSPVPLLEPGETDPTAPPGAFLRRAVVGEGAGQTV